MTKVEPEKITFAEADQLPDRYPTPKQYWKNKDKPRNIFKKPHRTLLAALGNQKARRLLEERKQLLQMPLDASGELNWRERFINDSLTRRAYKEVRHRWLRRIEYVSVLAIVGTLAYFGNQLKNEAFEETMPQPVPGTTTPSFEFASPPAANSPPSTETKNTPDLPLIFAARDIRCIGPAVTVKLISADIEKGAGNITIAVFNALDRKTGTHFSDVPPNDQPLIYTELLNQLNSGQAPTKEGDLVNGPTDCRGFPTAPTTSAAP